MRRCLWIVGPLGASFFSEEDLVMFWTTIPSAVFVIASVVILAPQAKAELIVQNEVVFFATFDDGPIHIIHGANPEPSVVAVIEPADINTDILVFDDSVLNIVGGSVDSFQANDTSVVNVAGGVLTADATAFDQSQVNIVGGELIDFLRAHDSSNLTISGGSIWGVEAFDDSVVQILGGQFTDALPAVQNSLSASGNASITLFGSFNYPAGPILDPTGTISGTLASGEPFSARFSIADAASIQIAVPEPSTCVLAVFGATAFLLAKRRRCRNPSA
jgi:hypothetical protein